MEDFDLGSKFYANGAAPSGVLEHPGVLKDPQKIRDSWMSQFGGSSNSNKFYSFNTQFL